MSGFSPRAGFRSAHTHLLQILIAVLATAWTASAALGGESGKARAWPALSTNQQYVESVRKESGIDISDEMSVFAFVFGSLDDRVKVYPTENYFYFSFHYRGIRYAGNLRFDALDRDQGKVHFVYFKDYTHWYSEEGGHNVVLSSERGVIVEKVDKLAYRLTYNGKSVVFELNDLRAVKPPEGLLNPDEIYIGPIFDESAFQFYLVYNPSVKVFHYILNEDADVPDRLYTSRISDNIVVGTRSGFAFYKDRHRPRKILIGVHASNGNVNNYLDGPFDQLPDNFIEGDTLKDAIIDSNPELDGYIDRFGSAPDKKTRHLIGPYLYYRSEAELEVFDNCAASSEVPRNLYYACFEIDESAS